MDRKSNFFALDDLPLDYIRPGTARRTLRVGDLLWLFITYERPMVAPTHQHDFESALYLLDGEMETTVGEETKLMRPGDGVIFPAGVAHGITSITPTVHFTEVWYPVPEEGQK